MFSLLSIGFMLLLSPGMAKLKVYLHAGQSNMEGQGSIEHLRVLVSDPETAQRYRHLVDEAGDWVVRDDVYVRYNEDERIGKLTTGFGFRTHKFGPELEFGHVVGNFHDETVLIIKTTYGGSSLAADFRPPSSGAPPYDYDLIGDDGTPASAVDLSFGHRYNQMITLINETLNDINYVIPDYDGSGYDVVGFLWFQGFSDAIDVRKINEYGQNLENLIDDVRSDLNLPDLLVMIGELGMQGTNPDLNHQRMRHIQRGVTEIDRYDGTVAFAEISPYMVVDPKDGFDYDGVGHFHYNGRADNLIEIGRVFGEVALNWNQDGEKQASKASLRTVNQGDESSP